MSEEKIEGRDLPKASTGNAGNRQSETSPTEEVSEALALVQEAVLDMEDSGLRESVEAAIEAIDSAREASDSAEGEQLGPVADAREDALDELEKGKIANLGRVIEQAQSIVK